MDRRFGRWLALSETVIRLRHGHDKAGWGRGAHGARTADASTAIITSNAQRAPTDPNSLSFLTLTTRPTLPTDFRATDGGRTAVYVLR